MSSIPQPERVPVRQSISRQHVVDAAIEIIDTEGQDALSMRRLAKSLGVYPTTIYWHAGNRAQLESLIYQHILDQIQLPDIEAIEWDQWIPAMARAVRFEFSKHPDLAAGYASRLQVTSSGLKFAETMVTVLHRGGFRSDQLVFAYNTVMTSVFGWISSEFAAEPTDADDDWRSYLEEHVSTNATSLPYINRYRTELLNRGFSLRWDPGQKSPLTDSFEFSICVVVEGLKALKD